MHLCTGTWLSVYAYPAIYITIGVGVDDIFIMTQAWMQSGKVDVTERLAETYQLAGGMMLATTLTTCAAFLATALLSSIGSMQCFGLLTAFSLFFNYLLVLTFYAGCLVMRHRRTPPLGVQRVATSDGDDDKACSERSTAARRRAMPRWTTLATAPIRYPRLVTCIFACVVVPFTAWHISGLEIDDRPPHFLPWGHPAQRAYLDNADFGKSPLEAVSYIRIVWGLAPDPLDARGVNQLRNKDDLGEPVLDPAFTLDELAQRHLLHACTLLRASSLVKYSSNLLSNGATEKDVMCWPEAFRDFLTTHGHPFPAPDAEAALLAWLGQVDSMMDEASANEIAQDFGFLRSGSGEVVLRYVQLRAGSNMPSAYAPPTNVLEAEYHGWQVRTQRTLPAHTLKATQTLSHSPAPRGVPDLLVRYSLLGTRWRD